MIEGFVRNGRMMALFIAIIVVSGLASLSVLPRSEDPALENRFAIVITHYPGASAERVESLITEPIEQRLRRIAEIDYIESTSRAQISILRVKLKGSVSDGAPIFSLIRDQLADIQTDLPAQASQPILDEERSFAYTELIALNWQGPGEPQLIQMGRYAEELKSQLLLVTDTDIVNIYGQNQEQILVELDQHKAALAGISIERVIRAINQADVKVPAGKLVNSENQLQIEIIGALDSLDRIRNIPIYSEQFAALTVSDIASVERQLINPLTKLAIVNGKPAIVVGTRMLQNARIDHWTEQVNTALDQFTGMLPSSIGVEVLFSQNRYTQQRLTELLDNIFIGFALIAIVLLFTLGMRAAAIVTAALPLTVLFTLAVMRFYDLPIHQMSITGLVVALGIMVDNAIVMTDTVLQKKKQGINGLQAVIESVRHLWMPLLGSTLTTILAFMPIALMPGDAGEFIGGIALSVIFALIGSYLISHTVVAGLSGRFLKRATSYPSGTKLPNWLTEGMHLPRLNALFVQSLQLALTHPKTATLLLIALPLSGFISAQHLQEQFFPPSDRDMFHIEVYLPAQNSLQATYQLTDNISQHIAQYDGIKSVNWFVGESAPSFYYNLVGAKDGMQNYAQAMITTKHFSVANQLIPKLQLALDDKYPQAQIIVRKLEQGPPFNAPIEIRLFGPSLDTLKQLGDQLRLIINHTEDVIHSRATLLAGTPKIWLDIDETIVNGQNMGLTDIAGQLQSSLDGQKAGSVIEATQSIDVRVRRPQSLTQSSDDLYSFPIVTQGQTEFMPLSTVSQLSLSPSHGAIPHRDGRRVNIIEGYLRAGVLPSIALDKIKQQISATDFVLPPGYHLEIGGEAGARNSAVTDLMSSIGIIAILLVTTVVLSFNSFRISLIIFTTALMSAGLGLLSVWLFNYPFGFTVIIALLGLSGLAINSAIVILAELKADSQAIKADTTSIIGAVTGCTRHISSTTITTVGGFLPLIIAGGGFWPPFAIAIAGGTVLTTLLSFYLVPVMFYRFARYKAFEQTSQSRR
ncbi:efflux RND transporter permease subunit [Thalassotalea ponticola]|uniref:efflux RND transporter permease subunit n=1 Tax=Thalassotalea ponticola TaxID=1523392 RepID=UPI0025B3270C|nr:efflux RND transporter permease subunit [Thalassotalea ponticola]MDN3653228.1 efflux RND transporter permease subunit [Thalassotalea ponticola]